MKKMCRVWTVLLTLAGFALLSPVVSLAAFDSGSTGADGALEVTQNTQLQLPPDGVFNFTNVHIAPGATLTFKKNEKNTPVIILASGDVLIEGTINVSGSNDGHYLDVGKGGPGGFDGGVGGGLKAAGTRGKGPGGGGAGAGYGEDYTGAHGGGAGFVGAGANGSGSYYNRTPGGVGGAAYGNANLIPMIGGSGGGGSGGSRNTIGGAGGGGGGAILVASSGTLTVKGATYANGGNGGTHPRNYWYDSGGGGGSAGAIHLVATTIAGNGPITATGGQKAKSGGNGSSGRIRLEAWNFLRTAGTRPDYSMKWYPYGAIMPSLMPSLAITSIGGIGVPTLPHGDVKNPDIMFPPDTKMPLTVVVAGTNIPVGTKVTVKALSGMTNDVWSASGTLTGSEAASTASMELDFSMRHPSVLTVSATFQATVAMGAPDQIDGEKVEQIRVASTVGGGSEIVYITESGREVPATM